MSRNVFNSENKEYKDDIVLSPDKVKIFGVTTIRIGGRWYTSGLFGGKQIIESASYDAQSAILRVLDADGDRNVLGDVTRLVIGPFIAVALVIERHINFESVVHGEISYGVLHLGEHQLSQHSFEKVEVWEKVDPMEVVTCNRNAAL